MTGETDVAIVGAGPYGLSIAAHLGEFGIEFRVFGDPMHMRERMRSTFDWISSSADQGF